MRVTTDGEDFVIAPNDYNNGNLMSWNKAMGALNADNLTTWNYHQMSLAIQYRDEINNVLIDYGKNRLYKSYWTCEENPFDTAYAYFGHYDDESKYILDADKGLSSYVRPIKNLKKEVNDKIPYSIAKHF